MKRNVPEPPVATEAIDPELDAENLEFDFSRAPRPGRNDLFERAQGHFHEVPDPSDVKDGHVIRVALEPQRRTRQKRS